MQGNGICQGSKVLHRKDDVSFGRGYACIAIQFNPVRQQQHGTVFQACIPRCDKLIGRSFENDGVIGGQVGCGRIILSLQ